ncbi:MAG: recombination protein O N-terminal domain-containing protein [Bacilli bacterium]
MLIDIEGIVLDERSFGESSKILNVITPKYGVIGVIAKGSKKIKSPLCSVTSRLTYGRFYLY